MRHLATDVSYQGIVPLRSFVTALIMLACSLQAVANLATDTQLPFERTEAREPCADYSATRKPMFGDLHVHTRYSFDSYISSQRNDPWDAYRYAKGEAITLPGANGEQTVKAQIGRPLDFTAVTDHGEFLGQINVCTNDPGKLGYWWPHCIMTRANHLWVQLLAANWWTSLGGQLATEPVESFACTLSDCAEGGKEFWTSIQQAAEDHYDDSPDCNFTTFVGYEYTDSPDTRNMHRNVIFRNAAVTDMPISAYQTGRYNFPVLWQMLREQCTEGGEGCDVISIPHNPNLAGGLMFRDPETPEELNNRLYYEPIIELVQHKAASECRFDRLAQRGVGTEDELCDFEQVAADNLSMLGSVEGKVRTERAAMVEVDDFASRNMIRNVLKDGLALQQSTGDNPFVMGFIGSTDTHSAAPGAAEEDNYIGHLGRRDSEYRNVQDHFFSNPGGHAVVWAEENSRDAIFSGMKRRETYATSGTRPIVRFFGGADIEAGLCEDSNMVARAYAQGVPMGGDIYAEAGDAAPRFLVSATKDSGTATSPGYDLQRVQIIKGWVDAGGATHEKVYDVAGDANNGATVDTESCAPIGTGFSQLCTVWSDPEFDASQNAFYYVRALENPSCRWSTLQCQAVGVNPFSDSCAEQAEQANAVSHKEGANGDVWGKCCINPEEQPFYTPVIQERAWTSPIWYHPVSS